MPVLGLTALLSWLSAKLVTSRLYTSYFLLNCVFVSMAQGVSGFLVTPRTHFTHIYLANITICRNKKNNIEPTLYWVGVVQTFSVHWWLLTKHWWLQTIIVVQPIVCFELCHDRLVCSYFLVVLSSAKLWHDSLVCSYDLERLDGRNGEWEPNCGRSQVRPTIEILVARQSHSIRFQTHSVGILFSNT